MHQLEGMALIVNEALDEQKPPPLGFNQCGDVSMTVEKYEEVLALLSLFLGLIFGESVFTAMRCLT